MIATKCGECGREFEALDEHRGMSVTCPGCRRPVDVPGSEDPIRDDLWRVTAELRGIRARLAWVIALLAVIAVLVLVTFLGLSGAVSPR